MNIRQLFGVFFLCSGVAGMTSSVYTGQGFGVCLGAALCLFGIAVHSGRYE